MGSLPLMSSASEFRDQKERPRKTHCQAGHPLTPSNTREEVTVCDGKVYLVRTCKTCERTGKRAKRRQDSSSR